MNALPVVLVHGTRTSATQWDRQLPSLGAAGHRPHAIDLPGHGTRRREPFDLVPALETIAAAVRGAPSPVHLVGSSLGGMLAIHAAARGLENLASLTVCGGAVQPTPLSARLYGAMIELADHLPGVSAEGRGWLFTWILGPEGAHAYLRGGRADASVVRPSMEAVASLDLLGDLRRIPVPVTFLHGRLDQLRLQERQFAAAAPDGRLEVLPYGTHMVNLNRPERFTADLLRVLGRIERERGPHEREH